MKIMTSEDQKIWLEFRSSKSSRVSKKEVLMIAKLYSVYMNKKYIVPCSCNGKRLQSWIDKINEVYEYSKSS